MKRLVLHSIYALFLIFPGSNLSAHELESCDSSLMDFWKWDWESSNDGGENWTLQWRINYTLKE